MLSFLTPTLKKKKTWLRPIGILGFPAPYVPCKVVPSIPVPIRPVAGAFLFSESEMVEVSPLVPSWGFWSMDLPAFPEKMSGWWMECLAPATHLEEKGSRLLSPIP